MDSRLMASTNNLIANLGKLKDLKEILTSVFAVYYAEDGNTQQMVADMVAAICLCSADTAPAAPAKGVKAKAKEESASITYESFKTLVSRLRGTKKTAPVEFDFSFKVKASFKAAATNKELLFEEGTEVQLSQLVNHQSLNGISLMSVQGRVWGHISEEDKIRLKTAAAHLL